MKKFFITLAVIAGLVMAVPFAFMALLTIGEMPTTSTWGYASRIADLKQHNFVFRIFPDKIPDEAKNVRFYFEAGFRGENMQLRYQLPAESITSIQDELERIKILSYQGGSPPAGRYPQGPPHDFDPTEEGMDTPDFEFFVLDDLKHGVAINRKANEVLYWMYVH